MNPIKKISISLILILLSSCTVKDPNFTNASSDIDKVLHDSVATDKKLAANANKNNKFLPIAVRNALMPGINIPNANSKNTASNRDTEQYFDISVNNVPAKDFFMGLVKNTKHNITISSEIAGNITLELNGVSVPQTMEAIRNLYGFEYERTSYGYQIFPRRLETKIFNVNYLNIGRTGQTQINIGSSDISNSNSGSNSNNNVAANNNTQQSSVISSIQTTSTSNFWTLLKQNLLAIIGTSDGHSVVINPESGSIIIKAYPDELRSVAQYLDGIQNIMQRQVIIEAKVLDVELTANYQAGIDWKVLGLQQTSTLGTSNSNYTALNPLGTFSLNANSHSAFTTAINLISTQGTINVLSSPRVSTINNQKAVIKVGGDRFYVTNISSNVTSNVTTSTANSVSFTPFFSGISLDVTPQIDEDDCVTMHIHPVVSQVSDDIRSFNINGTSSNNNTSVPMAKSTIKESDSIVRAKNGQVIVIGGLMTNSRVDNNSSTPVVDRVPGVNGLFKNSDKQASKTELVILLRPIIVYNDDSDNTWRKHLQESAKNIKSMRNSSKGQFGFDIVPTRNKNKGK